MSLLWFFSSTSPSRAWLRRNAFYVLLCLTASLPAYLLTCFACLLACFLLAFLLASSPTCLPAHLSAHLPACLPTCLLAGMLAGLGVCLLASLPACLPACLHACLPACLLAYMLELSKTHFQCFLEECAARTHILTPWAPVGAKKAYFTKWTTFGEALICIKKILGPQLESHLGHSLIPTNYSNSLNSI